METVAANSDYPDEAWGLIQAITTEQGIVADYIERTQLPAALKAVLADQQEDYVLSIFADQSLTAQSWYAGNDPTETESIFENMITVVNEGRLSEIKAVQNAADQVSLTYDKD